MLPQEINIFFTLQGRRGGVDQAVISSLKLNYEDGESESYCLSDAGLAAIGEGFIKLEKLSLIWCSNVTSLGLRSIAEKCRYLKSLDLQVRSSLLGSQHFNFSASLHYKSETLAPFIRM